jgi:hypothetical protein
MQSLDGLYGIVVLLGIERGDSSLECVAELATRGFQEVEDRTLSGEDRAERVCENWVDGGRQRRSRRTQSGACV